MKIPPTFEMAHVSQIARIALEAGDAYVEARAERH